MALVGMLMAALVWFLTRDEVRTYTSSALVDTGIYSGYNLVSNGSRNLDYHQASADLDNLLNIATAFETYEELGQRLLGECLLLEAPDRTLLSPRAFEVLHTAIPDSVAERVRSTGDPEKAFQMILGYCQRGDDNPIYTLLYSTQSLWGIDHFSTIKIKTEGKSDMLRETYTTDDPGVCKRTLELHIQIYSHKRSEIKKKMGKNVVEYFRQQLDDNKGSLRQAEDELTEYMRTKKIINYYEQTRFIAAKREDLLELEFKEYMKLKSSDSTLETLEGQMGHRLGLGRINREIGYLRDSLAEISTELARLEWLSPLDASGQQDLAHIQALKAASERLKGNIMQAGDSIYRMQVTPRGAELDQLLFQWLRNMMIASEAEAKLSAVGGRKQAFDSMYQALAPVGSEIKRLERKSYVQEQSYLENLHSLNEAIMRQQNILMSSALSMISHPYFPSRPDPSSRKFLIVAAFLAGFVLTLGVIVGLEYFDSTLRSPENAERVVGLTALGALPRFPVLPKLGQYAEDEFEGEDGKGKKKKKQKKPKVDYAFLEDRAVGLLLQNIKLDLKRRGITTKPHRIVLISMRRQEGKSLLASMLAERLRHYNERILLLSPEESIAADVQPEAEKTDAKPQKKKKKPGTETQPLPPPHDDNHPYPVPPWFYDIDQEESLVSEENFSSEGFDTFITELPPLLIKPYPVHIINRADVVLLICRANRVWNIADTNTLLKIQSATNKDIRLVLNGTSIDHLESTMGFIPKKRSLLRRLAKQVFTRGFQQSDEI